MSAALEQLFPGLGPGGFVADKWPNHSYDEPGAPERLALLGRVKDITTIHQLGELGPFQGDVSFRAADTGHTFEVALDSTRGAVLHEAGLTACWHDLDRRLPELDELAHSLARELGVPRDCVSIAGYGSAMGHGVDQHFDGQEVIVVQLAGHKRWRVWSNEHVEWPDRSYSPLHWELAPRPFWGGFHPAAEVPEHARVIDMKPGSVLFMPRGTWHATLAGQDSVSLTIKIAAPTWRDLIAEALTESLSSHWHQPLGVAEMAVGEVRTGAANSLSDALGWPGAAWLDSEQRAVAFLGWVRDSRVRGFFDTDDDGELELVLENEAGEQEGLQLDPLLRPLAEDFLATTERVDRDDWDRWNSRFGVETVAVILEALVAGGFFVVD